ncbi:family 10 glycosylhydrolase [Paenibacillus sp. sptzw28]|uniref:alpha amylase family protein n=1 Tax=Paenibacillus sp. sptzw28 TaxID=715179 RepID=UPI001C6F0715|nr:alpha amylase family protein [Paenibacillus sp. sptzw28]QYR19197.1 family 10 glycosylhydrolase [Paenibacillus sp. sptzw28]
MSRYRKTIVFILVICMSMVIPFHTLGANDPSILENVEHDAVLENFINAQGLEVKGLKAQEAINQHYKGNAVADNGLKANILWYDLAANLSRLNTRESVRAMLDKTKKAKIDTVVLDVKNYTGFVGYQSQFAPHISSSTIPRYQNFFAPNYDLLATVIEEAHSRGIKVHAAVNVFSEGNNDYKDGPAFRHPEWQTQFYYATQVITALSGSQYDLFGTNVVRATDTIVKYTSNYANRVNRWGLEAIVIDNKIVEIIDGVTTGQIGTVPVNGYILSGHGAGRTWMLSNLKVGDTVNLNQSKTSIIPASRYPTFSTFVNPLVPEVREYELNIIKEIVTNYDVDGLVLDRARYSNIYADFSDLSRKEFEKYIGNEVQNWPSDIFTVTFTDTGTQIIAGPLYKKWIEWRAHNIFNFFADAKALVKSIDNNVDFSTYVGSWYPYYYSEGVNWGSQDYHPNEPWASEDYHKYGYAGLLDFIMTGLYYSDITIEEALASGNPEWMSVEGAGNLSTEVVNQDTFVYGSLYLLQYQGQPERFKQAIKKTLETTNGIMIFDLVYLEMYDWWYILEDVLKPSHPPHENNGLNRLTK